MIRKIFNTLDFKAIVLGAVIDWVSTIIFNIFYFGFLFRSLQGDIADEDELQQVINSDFHLRVTLMFGLFFTGMAAYFCMKFSSKKHINNAIAIGIISLFSGISDISTMPLWYKFVAISSVIPIAYYGGKIYLNRLEK